MPDRFRFTRIFALTRTRHPFKFLVLPLLLCGLPSLSLADTITIDGLITQSTPDGTGPAVNNTSLNNIADGQAFRLTLIFSGSITSPGTYTPSSLVFSDPSAPASEMAFSSISLTITNSASLDQFSLLGCLSSGSGCGFGNELDANFQIPAAMLNSQNVTATGLDPPHPLDLLEDDGTTDIQGSLTQYSYIGTTAVPEPSPAVPLVCMLLALSIVKSKSVISRTYRRTS